MTWVAKNPTKVLITLVSAALVIWANFSLAAYLEAPRLESYPATAVLDIHTHDKVCWTASDLKGVIKRGCGNGTAIVRRSPASDREFGESAFVASVVKKKQTDVRNITASLIIDGDVVDTVTTNNYSLSVFAPD